LSAFLIGLHEATRHRDPAFADRFYHDRKLYSASFTDHRPTVFGHCLEQISAAFGRKSGVEKGGQKLSNSWGTLRNLSTAC
jgi:hypothetical protein